MASLKAQIVTLSQHTQQTFMLRPLPLKRSRKSNKENKLINVFVSDNICK